jgi:hypothetical protein
LTRTRDQLDELLAWSAHERPGATVLLEHILGLEAAHKLEQRVTRRIDTSGLVERKSLEVFDWDFQPSLDKSLVLELARLDFVRRHDDLVITGNNGTGKSHLLKAFALRACEQGLHMRYARCVDLLDDLHAGLADGTYARRLKGWARPALLIIDDVGLGQVTGWLPNADRRAGSPDPSPRVLPTASVAPDQLQPAEDVDPYPAASATPAATAAMAPDPAATGSLLSRRQRQLETLRDTAPRP